MIILSTKLSVPNFRGDFLIDEENDDAIWWDCYFYKLGSTTVLKKYLQTYSFSLFVSYFVMPKPIQRSPDFCCLSRFELRMRSFMITFCVANFQRNI